MADPTLERLRDQLGWYDKAAGRSQRSFRIVKLVQLVAAASVSVAAVAGAGAVVSALIGAVILILEGVQALFGWQQNWVNYRNTAEALKSEQHLFAAHAGPYASSTNPARLLAERVEGLLSTERSGWVVEQLPPGASQAPPAANGQPAEPLAGEVQPQR
jgi:uncharacterized protein DUF4231